MTRNILFAMLLSLVPTTPAMAAPDTVDLALQGVGTGSAQEMRKRIFILSFTVSFTELRAQALAIMPGFVRSCIFRWSVNKDFGLS